MILPVALQWLVLGGALVFFMHSGFALLEVGSVSERNIQNILFKNTISPTFAAILFWFCGFVFAFGDDSDFIGTKQGWLLAGDYIFEPSGAGMPYSSNTYATWFFQWAFAATASTIVSGAVAERINTKVYGEPYTSLARIPSCTLPVDDLTGAWL
jgi:Amt family ammonium transporter